MGEATKPNPSGVRLCELFKKSNFLLRAGGVVFGEASADTPADWNPPYWNSLARLIWLRTLGAWCPSFFLALALNQEASLGCVNEANPAGTSYLLLLLMCLFCPYCWISPTLLDWLKSWDRNPFFLIFHVPPLNQEASSGSIIEANHASTRYLILLVLCLFLPYNWIWLTPIGIKKPGRSRSFCYLPCACFESRGISGFSPRNIIYYLRTLYHFSCYYCTCFPLWSFGTVSLAFLSYYALSFSPSASVGGRHHWSVN